MMKQKIKTIALGVSSSITLTFLNVTSVFAQNSITGGKGQTSGKIVSPIGDVSTAKVLETFFTFLIQLGAIAVTLAIVYAGFLFVTAVGKPDQIEKARKTFFWTIIGALVLLGAQLIAKVIENTITTIGS